MNTGDPTSVAPGENEHHVDTFDLLVNSTGRGARLTVRAAAGYGNNHWAVVVDERIQNIIFLPEGELVEIDVLFSLDQSIHIVSLSPLGSWDSDVDIDVTQDQRNFESDKGKSAIITWDAVIEEIESFNDLQQLSNLVLTGLRRFTNARTLLGKSTQAALDIQITDVAGTRTVILSISGFVIASGSRVGDGTITLTASNNSGIIAPSSVDIVYSADVTLAAGAFAAIRWAASYEVHVAVQPTISFPRTAEKIILDDGKANNFAAVIDNLGAGTFDYVIRAVTDSGTVGTNTAVLGSFIVPGRPEAPGTPVYASGDNTNTVLDFLASTTGGATYRAYDSVLGEATNFEVIAATAGAGGGTLSINMPSIGAAAGIRRIVVVAVSGGIEDAERKAVEVEYDAAGVVVTPRPNVPGFRLESISGRTIKVRWYYDPSDALDVATVTQLFIFAEGATPVFTTPDATSAIAAGVGIQTGTFEFTVGSDAWFNWLVKAATAAGIQSRNVELQGPIYLSTATPAVPANDASSVVI